MNQEVRRIMTTNPTVASPNQSISEVKQVMLNQQIQQLPVVEDGVLKGIITSYDLWRMAENHDVIDHLHVGDVMNTHVVKIAPKDKVGTAAELFADSRFKTLPVVNLRNELKGVITAFDLIKEAFREEYSHPILYKEVFAMEN